MLGVRLATGEEIKAATVVSSADPRRTLLGLVGAPELPPEFVWQAQSIRMRGSVAKLFVQTDGATACPQARSRSRRPSSTSSAPTTRRSMARCRRHPYLEVTTSGADVAVHFQFAPYALRHADWGSMRPELEKRALDTLALHFPAVQGLGAVSAVRSRRSTSSRPGA